MSEADPDREGLVILMSGFDLVNASLSQAPPERH
jgi:hypothetical protein